MLEPKAVSRIVTNTMHVTDLFAALQLEHFEKEGAAFHREIARKVGAKLDAHPEALRTCIERLLNHARSFLKSPYQTVLVVSLVPSREGGDFIFATGSHRDGGIVFAVAASRSRVSRASFCGHPKSINPNLG